MSIDEAGAMEKIIDQQIIVAMKTKQAERLGTLRLIKNSLKNKVIEKRSALTPQESEQIFAGMIKQRRDSIEQFAKGNRPDLVAIEAAEITIIEEFLPKAMDSSALTELIHEVVAEVGSQSGVKPTAKEMGPVMKAVQAKLAATGLRAEGRTVSELVKKALGS